MKRLDDDLLTAFIEGFYGYGNLAGPHWFIGMEEGGGNTVEDIERRLEAWRERGRHLTEDLVDYHLAIGISKHFGEKPVLQPTWSKLIRVLNGLEGKPTGTDALRQTQANTFGRRDGTSCLLELLPLPSPATNQWLYGRHADLPYLKDRSLYLRTVMPRRIEALRALIAQYRPQTVLFYGLNYRAHWESICEQTLTERDVAQFRILESHNSHTIFVATPHPTSVGITNSYFDQVSKLMVSA